VEGKKLLPRGDNADRLMTLLKAQSVFYGKFVLASGQASNYYIDARQTFLNWEGSHLAGRITNNLLQLLRLNAVAGPVTGSCPIISSTLALHQAMWRDRGGEFGLKGGYIRSAQKDHGRKRLVEGPLTAGDRVLLVEDTSTTGNTVLAAAQALADEGIVSPAALIFIDRGVEALEFARLGIELYVMCQASELIDSGKLMQAQHAESSGPQ
jgi:orotate phosphoribosyltransferase